MTAIIQYCNIQTTTLLRHYHLCLPQCHCLEDDAALETGWSASHNQPCYYNWMGGSVSGINFLPITHMCVHSCVLACMCMCKVYYQFLTWSQRSLHAWLTSIVPIMSRILIRPCLIIVNIAFYDHLIIIIIIIISDQIDIVLGEWWLNFKLLAFCYSISQPIVWPVVGGGTKAGLQLRLVPTKAGHHRSRWALGTRHPSRGTCEI